MRKILKVGAGFVLLLAGLVLAIPGVPGPGLALILLGLIVLSEHFHWARRSVEWVKRKTEQAKEKARTLRTRRPAPGE